MAVDVCWVAAASRQRRGVWASLGFVAVRALGDCEDPGRANGSGDSSHSPCKPQLRTWGNNLMSQNGCKNRSCGLSRGVVAARPADGWPQVRFNLCGDATKLFPRPPPPTPPLPLSPRATRLQHVLLSSHLLPSTPILLLDAPVATEARGGARAVAPMWPPARPAAASQAMPRGTRFATTEFIHVEEDEAAVVEEDEAAVAAVDDDQRT